VVQDISCHLESLWFGSVGIWQRILSALAVLVGDGKCGITCLAPLYGGIRSCVYHDTVWRCERTSRWRTIVGGMAVYTGCRTVGADYKLLWSPETTEWQPTGDSVRPREPLSVADVEYPTVPCPCLPGRALAVATVTVTAQIA
jgi:hypothetical protein